jgi:transcriptional regulator with XRE-family HTH domain
MSEANTIGPAGRAAGEDAFAVRLLAAMERKGWSQAETARQVAKRLPPGHRFHRAHVNHYVRGRATPRGERLEALTAALGLGSPGSGHAGAPIVYEVPASIAVNGASTSRISARDVGDGRALLEITDSVPWHLALRVLEMLRAESA